MHDNREARRKVLDEVAKRVTAAMELWVDAVMDHLATGEPNLTEVNRLENAAAAAWSGFAGATARTLLGYDDERQLVEVEVEATPELPS